MHAQPQTFLMSALINLESGVGWEKRCLAFVKLTWFQLFVGHIAATFFHHYCHFLLAGVAGLTLAVPEVKVGLVESDPLGCSSAGVVRWEIRAWDRSCERSEQSRPSRPNSLLTASSESYCGGTFMMQQGSAFTLDCLWFSRCPPSDRPWENAARFKGIVYLKLNEVLLSFTYPHFVLKPYAVTKHIRRIFTQKIFSKQQQFIFCSTPKNGQKHQQMLFIWLLK